MHGANGDFKIIDPLVLGHEAGGVITALGPEPASPTSRNAEGQSRLKVGDRVAIECGHACGGCRMCKEGRYNLCKVRTACAIVNLRRFRNQSLIDIWDASSTCDSAVPPSRIPTWTEPCKMR
jgi:D-arabinose 1-dehydrogenase-like Zn-dependent alcohol dehydrogenase